MKKSFLHKIISTFIAVTFLITTILPPQVSFAQISAGQSILNLPAPGVMVTQSPGFAPPVIRGLTPNPQNPLQFDFYIATGEDRIQGEELRTEANKLIKYFLASLTVPEEELWVNLSPYESERIIPDAFGETEMGRDLLAQDYILKQLTASLIYPEDELGKEFWKRVHKKAYEKFGTTDIPMNTFNKVWIVPQEAVVLEHEGSAFILESRLKVMLEEDYLALKKNLGEEKFGTNRMADKDVELVSGISSEVVREVIIPEIEKEVNEGRSFAQLRQVYHSVILATWFKKRLKESLLGYVYVDQNKVQGVDVEDKQIKQKIYNQYLAAFKVGVYDFIKEDYDPSTHEIIPRKYFSGGLAWQDINLKVIDGAMISSAQGRKLSEDDTVKVTAELLGIHPQTRALASQARDSFLRIKETQEPRDQRRLIARQHRPLPPRFERGRRGDRAMVTGQAKKRISVKKDVVYPIFRHINGQKFIPNLHVLASEGVFDESFGTAQNPKYVRLLDIAKKHKKGGVDAKRLNYEDNLGNVYGAFENMALAALLDMIPKWKETKVALVPLGWAHVKIAESGYFEKFYNVLEHSKDYHSFLRRAPPYDQDESEAINKIVKELEDLLDTVARFTKLIESLKKNMENREELERLLIEHLSASEVRMLTVAIKNMPDEIGIHVIQRAIVQVHTYLIGTLMSPVMVALGMPEFNIKNRLITEKKSSILKLFEEDRLNLESLDNTYNHDLMRLYFELLERVGIVRKDGNSIILTQLAKAFFSKVASYGVTDSYTLIDIYLNEFLFGDPNVLNLQKDEHMGPNAEYRIEDIWGSSGAHDSYMGQYDKETGEILRPGLLSITRREFHERELDDQPLGLFNMGSGEGKLTRDELRYLLKYTKRGQNLKDHPLVVVVSDFNQAALKRERDVMAEFEGIEGLHVIVMWADVTNPEQFNENLIQELANIGFEGYDKDDLLHTEEFIPHEMALTIKDESVARNIIKESLSVINRQALEIALGRLGIKKKQIPRDLESLTDLVLSQFQGSYSNDSPQGRLVPGYVVAANKINMLKRYSQKKDPTKKSFPIRILELHKPRAMQQAQEVPLDINEPMIAEQTLAIAYQATHWPSQYILPYEEDILVTVLAGLRADSAPMRWRSEKGYYVAVSLNSYIPADQSEELKKEEIPHWDLHGVAQSEFSVNRAIERAFRQGKTSLLPVSVRKEMQALLEDKAFTEQINQALAASEINDGVISIDRVKELAWQLTDGEDDAVVRIVIVEDTKDRSPAIITRADNYEYVHLGFGVFDGKPRYSIYLGEGIFEAFRNLGTHMDDPQLLAKLLIFQLIGLAKAKARLDTEALGTQRLEGAEQFKKYDAALDEGRRLAKEIEDSVVDVLIGLFVEDVMDQFFMAQTGKMTIGMIGTIQTFAREFNLKIGMNHNEYNIHQSYIKEAIRSPRWKEALEKYGSFLVLNRTAIRTIYQDNEGFLNMLRRVTAKGLYKAGYRSSYPAEELVAVAYLQYFGQDQMSQEVRRLQSEVPRFSDRLAHEDLFGEISRSIDTVLAGMDIYEELQDQVRNELTLYFYQQLLGRSNTSPRDIRLSEHTSRDGQQSNIGTNLTGEQQRQILSNTIRYGNIYRIETWGGAIQVALLKGRRGGAEPEDPFYNLREQTKLLRDRLREALKDHEAKLTREDYDLLFDRYEFKEDRRILTDNELEDLLFRSDLSEETKKEVRQIYRIRQEMLERGVYIVGLDPYPDSVIENFVRVAYKNGVDVFRIFDALDNTPNITKVINYVEGLVDRTRQTAKIAGDVGARVQPVVHYTTDFPRGIEGFVVVAKELLAATGETLDSLVIKDAGGLLDAREAFNLVKALRDADITVPIQIHTHDTRGNRQLTLLETIRANGGDHPIIVDVATGKLAAPFAQPNIRQFLGIIEGSNWEGNLGDVDYEAIEANEAFIEDQILRQFALRPHITSRLRRDIVEIGRMPGGMLSNFEADVLKEMEGGFAHAMELMINQGLAEGQQDSELISVEGNLTKEGWLFLNTMYHDLILPEMRLITAEIGGINLVTPSSDWVGKQAFRNVVDWFARGMISVEKVNGRFILSKSPDFDQVPRLDQYSHATRMWPGMQNYLILRAQDAAKWDPVSGKSTLGNLYPDVSEELVKRAFLLADPDLTVTFDKSKGKGFITDGVLAKYNPLKEALGKDVVDLSIIRLQKLLQTAANRGDEEAREALESGEYSRSLILRGIAMDPFGILNIPLTYEEYEAKRDVLRQAYPEINQTDEDTLLSALYPALNQFTHLVERREEYRRRLEEATEENEKQEILQILIRMGARDVEGELKDAVDNAMVSETIERGDNASINIEDLINKKVRVKILSPEKLGIFEGMGRRSFTVKFDEKKGIIVVDEESEGETIEYPLTRFNNYRLVYGVNSSTEGLVDIDSGYGPELSGWDDFIPLIEFAEEVDKLVVRNLGIGTGISLGRSEPTETVQTDVAVIGKDQQQRYGGIDLNPALLDLQIKRDERGKPLPVYQQPIMEMNIEGFLPVIINVTPVANLPLLLGLVTDEEESEHGYPSDYNAREPERLSMLN